MASRLLSDSILPLRPRRPMLPTLSLLSRSAARAVIVVVLLLGVLLFVYLAEVSQGTATAFDIEYMAVQYHQLQEGNQELERQIAELESPQHVMRYASAHGMEPRTQVEYILIHPAVPVGP